MEEKLYVIMSFQDHQKVLGITEQHVGTELAIMILRTSNNYPKVLSQAIDTSRSQWYLFYKMACELSTQF